jgi:hypothetical protein
MPFINMKKFDEVLNNLKLLSLKLREASSNFSLIEDVIMSYNRKFKNVWSFYILKKYFSELSPGEEAMI